MIAADPFDQVVSRLPDAKGRGDSVTARCPAHDDRNPSLSVSRGDVKAVVLICRTGCEPDAILRALNLDPAPILAARSDGSGQRSSTYRPSGQPSSVVTVAKLARDKGLPASWLREKVGLSDAIGRPGVEIPYYSEHGAPLFTRRRTIMGGKSVTLQPPGEPLKPYGLDRLDAWLSSTRPILVEGESDRWTLRHHDREALGLPGASSAGCLELPHVEGAASLFVHQEPDQGGVTFYSGIRDRLAALGWSGRLYAFKIVLDGRRIKDPSDLHLAVKGDRAKFLAALEASLDSAVPVGDDEAIAWDIAEDGSDWPAAARARIAELEAALADGSAKCDGNCSTAVALRDQVREYKAEIRLLTDGPVSIQEAAYWRYLADLAVKARAEGKDRIELFKPKDIEASGASGSTITRATNKLRTAIPATLPFLVHDYVKNGKDRVALLLAPDDDVEKSDQPAYAMLESRRSAYAGLMRAGLAEERKKQGGSANAVEARWRCPDHRDSAVIETRTTVYRCAVDGCDKSGTYHSPPVIHPGSADRIQLESGVTRIHPDRIQLDALRLTGEGIQVESGRPISFVTDDDRAMAYGKPLPDDRVSTATPDVDPTYEDQAEQRTPNQEAVSVDLEPPVRPDDDDDVWDDSSITAEAARTEPPAEPGSTLRKASPRDYAWWTRARRERRPVAVSRTG